MRVLCAQALGVRGAHRCLEGGGSLGPFGVRTLLFGSGASGALLLALAAAAWSLGTQRVTGSLGTQRVTGWLLADRGSDQLLQIDRELRVTGWQPAAEPLRVVSRGPGLGREHAVFGPDAWWIEGLGGDPFGPHRLHALSLPLTNAEHSSPALSKGMDAAGGQWTYIRDLAVDGDGVAYVLSGALEDPEGELWCVRRGEAPLLLATLEGALKLVWTGAHLACGGSAGQLWRLTAGGRILSEAQVGTEIHALVADDAHLWCLDASGVLRRLGADLELLWSVDLGFTPGPLAVDRDHVAWVAAEGQPFLQPVDAEGGLLTPVTDVGGDSWTDLDAHAPTPLGAAPGYVLQLDAYGAALASQGGFGYLSDLTALCSAGS